MVDLLGPHGADDAGLIDDAAHARKQVAQHLAGLAEALEFVRRAEADQLLALELSDLLALGKGIRHGLAIHFGEFRLVVEGFEMRWPAGLVEKDDALGLGREIERIDDAFRRLLDGLCRREQARIDAANSEPPGPGPRRHGREMCGG